MPKKRKTIHRVRRVQASSRRAAAVTSSSLFQRLQLSESYMSLVLGLIVVVVSALFVVSLVRNNSFKLSQKVTQDISSTKTQQNVTPQATQNSQKIYTVVAGDNLWKISEKVYKSGYNWVDIAKANNLQDPGVITAGTKLSIPDVKPKVVAQANSANAPNTTISQTASDAISGTTYTVQKGDSLWDIAQRAYGDGYKWTDIVKANNISQPDLIFSGNELKIPRG